MMLGTLPLVLKHDDFRRLEEHVEARMRGRAREVHLRLCDCGIVIEGHAPTFYVKQLAQEAVREATRLPILANEIEVC